MPKKHVEIPASAHDLELFRLAAEHAPTHIIFTDTDGFIRYANPAAEKITGYTRKEMIGKRPSLWGGQMPKEFYLDMWHTIKDKKQVFHATINNKRKNGSAYVAEATITPVIEKGILIGFVGVERDVTNEKKLFDALEQKEELYRSLFDNMLNGFAYIRMVFNKKQEPVDFVYLEVNSAFEAQTGLKDVVGKKGTDVIPNLRKADPQLLRTYGKVALSRQPQAFEVFLQSLSKWFAVSTYSPEEGHVAIMFDDITARKRAEERTRELDVLKNKFIQVVSHQFRTPLNEVRWSLDALRNKQLGPLTAPQEEFARQTSEMNAEIIRRLDDLLTALDIEEGHGHLSPEESSLEDIVGGVVNESAKRCQQKGLTCTYVAPRRAVPAMNLDPDKIRRVTEKLIDNAIAYNKKKGSVRVTIERNGSWVRVSVADRGIGIPSADRKRIFSRFYRASNASRVMTDASGLGLYIAHHFVRAHEGKMGFTSTEGKGSMFWFDLPITR